MTCKRPDYPHSFIVFALIVAVLTVAQSARASTTALFQPAVTYSTGGEDNTFPNSGGPVWVIAADVNGDNKPDILVANWCVSPTECTKSNVGVLLNKGDGTFQPVVTYDTGGHNAFSVSVADMNGDGKPDLVVANGCADAFNQPSPGCPDGSVGVLLGNGDGTFQAVHNYRSGGSTSAIAMADLNNDGKLDVVVSNCAPTGQVCPFGNGTVGVLLGNGDGSFQPVQIYDSGGIAATFVAVADVNRDLKPDLLVSNQRICDNCLGNLGVLFGRGDGSFQAVQTYDAGTASPRFIIAGDLNSDQNPDVVLSGSGSQLAVVLNRGDGIFQSASVYPTDGLYGTPLVVSDVNGDGKPDLLVSNAEFCAGHQTAESCVAILLGNGDGTFQPPVTYDSGSIGAWWLTVADFDGDGKLDVAVAHQCNASSCSRGTARVGVLLGNGDGTFQQAMTYSSADLGTVFVLAADLNGDGKPDLVVGNARPLGSISVLLNSTAPRDTSPPVITVAATPGVLWPPNGRMRPVTISGTITDTGSGVNASTAMYAVKDEYGKIQPRGAITLAPGGNYFFTLFLRASRLGSDLDGRRYTVNIRATDNAGNRGAKTTVVTVPHDQGP